MASPTPGAVKAVDTLVGERVGDHILDELLGVGNAGAVYLARNQKNGYNVAIKVCEKKDPTSEEAVRLAREVEILSSLQHPHIVRLYDAFEDDSYVYIFMELALGGELIDYIAEVVRLEEPDARRIFRQIISAIDYAHRSNIVHRDLKLENLLIDSNNNIKLIDFSLANWIDSKSTLSTFCGSPDYAAPELWMFKDYEGKAVDVWSLGVILYATVCGSLPFDTAKDIIAQNYTLPDELSEPCKDLLRKMLEVRVDDRITIENIITHPWVNDGFPGPIERKPTWLSQQSAEKAHRAALEKRERANLRARQKRRRQALTGTGPAQSLPTGRKIAEMIAIEDEKRRRAVEAGRADKQAALQSKSLESVESTGSSDDADSVSSAALSMASLSSTSTQMSVSSTAGSTSMPIATPNATTTSSTPTTTTNTTASSSSGMGASGLKLDLTPPTSASLSRHINNEMAEQLKRVPVSNRIRIKVEVPGGVVEQLSVDPQASMATLKEQICHRHSLRDDVHFVVPSGAGVNYASKVYAYLAEGEKLRVRSPGYSFASPPSPEAHSTSDIDDAVSVTSIESLEDEERRLRQSVQASGSMRVAGHVITPQSSGRVVRTYSNRSLLSVESSASALGPVQEWEDTVKWRVVVRMPNDVKLRIPVGTQRTVGYLVEVALRKQNREPKLSKYRVFLDAGKLDVEVPLMDKIEDSLDEGEGIVIMRKEKKRVVMSPDALNLDEVVLVVDAGASGDKSQGDGGRGAGGIGVGAPSRSRRRRSSNASGGLQVTNRMLLEIADRMASPESGVTVDNRVYNSKVFAHTFVGREAVSWLVAEGCAPSRKAAVAMGSLMVERSVFSHVMSGHSFKDKQTSLFRFLGRWAARAIPLVDERSRSVDEERRMRLRMSQLQPHSDLLLPDQ